jgi:hypothetical protein
MSDLISRKAAIEAIQADIDIYEKATAYESPDDHQRGWFRGMYNAQTTLRMLGAAETPSAPAPRCAHNRVEMLAHADDSVVGGSGLLWSPICRDCGDDVPAAAE